MQFLPSIGSSIPNKLDCLKQCDHKKKYMSQLGGGFGSNDIFTQLEVQLASKDCLKICDHLKKKSPTCKVLAAIQFLQAVGSPFSLQNTA